MCIEVSYSFVVLRDTTSPMSTTPGGTGHLVGEEFRPSVYNPAIDGSDGEGEDHTELPFQKIHDQCKYMYYDINDIAVCAKPSPGYKYTAIHLNIHSLPSKYGQLTMLADFEDNGIFID